MKEQLSVILHCFWAPTFDYGLYKTSVFCVPASPILPRIPIQISANGTNPRRLSVRFYPFFRDSVHCMYTLIPAQELYINPNPTTTMEHLRNTCGMGLAQWNISHPRRPHLRPLGQRTHPTPETSQSTCGSSHFLLTSATSKNACQLITHPSHLALFMS